MLVSINYLSTSVFFNQQNTSLQYLFGSFFVVKVNQIDKSEQGVLEKVSLTMYPLNFTSFLDSIKSAFVCLSEFLCYPLNQQRNYIVFPFYSSIKGISN